MMFRYPYLFLLLLIIPLLVYLRYYRRRRPRVRFSDLYGIRNLYPGFGVLIQPLFPILYTIGLVLLVIALARPQKGLVQREVHTEGVDIILLVDVSPSMAAEDFSTVSERMNRLDAAKKVIDSFIRSRPDDRIGVVAFAAVPYSIAPLTLDHGWILQQVQRLESGSLGDATGIGDSLASAVNRLRESEAKSKLVILLTDGVNNTGEITPANAAQAAKALGIKVYTVAAGTEGIVRIPMQSPFGGTHYTRQRSEIDEATLQMIAEETGARFFRATDLNSLQDVYDEIDTMEKTEMDIEQYTRFEERFMPFAAGALILLALERFLSLSRWGRAP